MIKDDEASKSAGRPWWFAPALVAVVVGALAGAVTLDFASERRAVEMSTRSPIGGAFNAASYDVRVPADIAWIAGANCGFPTDSDAAARLEPPRQIATGLWTFDGCMLSGGTVLYDVTLSISFPGGEHLVLPVIKETNRYGETRFKVEVNRAAIGGASPTFYANHAPRP